MRGTMEDLKKMVQDCLGPLPRVCPEHVLLDMERARMQAEDLRGLLSQVNEALGEQEDERNEERDLVQYAMDQATVTLRRHLNRTGLSQRSREELTSVYNLLSEAASVNEGQQMQNATPLD